MFNITYTPYLSVHFRHPYYADGVTDDFDFTPTASTLERLASFGLRPKTFSGTLFIHQRLDERQLPFEPIDSLVDLFFTVSPTSDLLTITKRIGSGRYFFSNLKPDGSYNNLLTSTALLSAADVLPTVNGQQLVMEFAPESLTKIVMSQLQPTKGWQSVQELTVDANASHLTISVNHPGLYRIEKFQKAGGVEEGLLLMSDELKAHGYFWSLLHLQLKPGDQVIPYTVDLPAAADFWQYLIVEPEGRLGGALIPSKLVMKCLIGSRYPASLDVILQDPATYTDPQKKKVAAIKALPRVREVYLFRSTNPVSLLDGEQPQLKILYNAEEIASKVATPSRDRSETTLIYKL